MPSNPTYTKYLGGLTLDEKNNMNLSLETEDADNSALTDNSQLESTAQVTAGKVFAEADNELDAKSDQQDENSQDIQSPYNYQMNTYTSVQEFEAASVKKKSPVMPCVIVSACVLVLAIVLGVVYILFFNNSISGTYIIESAASESTDEEINQTYYVFDDEGNLTMLFGSMEFSGSYELTDENGASQITLDVSAANIYGTYSYSIVGNKFTGISIELYDTSGNVMRFVPAEYNDSVIEPIENASVDSALVGTWEDTSGYGVRYTFNEDSTLIMSGTGMIINGYYTAADGELSIEYMAASLVENDAEYSVEGEVLTLNGMEFQKAAE